MSHTYKHCPASSHRGLSAAPKKTPNQTPKSVYMLRCVSFCPTIQLNNKVICESWQIVPGVRARTEISGKKDWTKEVSVRQEKYKKISCFGTFSEFSKVQCRFSLSGQVIISQSTHQVAL